MRRFTTVAVAALAAALPLSALAQTRTGGLNLPFIQRYTDSFITLINDILVPLLFAVAFIFFLWSVARYFILGGADEKKRETGRMYVLYSVIGFVVILSLWGLVNFVDTVFRLSGYDAPTQLPRGYGPSGPGTQTQPQMQQSGVLNI